MCLVVALDHLHPEQRQDEVEDVYSSALVLVVVVVPACLLRIYRVPKIWLGLLSFSFHDY